MPAGAPAGPGGLARSRAAATNASTTACTRGSTRHSSCSSHCMPSTKRPGISIASITPSAARAEATRPGATASTAWWWKLSTVTSSPSRSCSRDPGGIAIRWRGVVGHGQVGHRRLLEPPPQPPCRVGRVQSPRLHQAQVLHHRPAERHVQHLHAPAAAEHRQAAVDRPLDELELEPVASGVHAPEQGVRLLAVAAGVDVVAGGEHHPGHRVELIVEPPRDAGEDHRHGARHRERALVADARVVAVAVKPGRDADQRFRARGS